MRKITFLIRVGCIAFISVSFLNKLSFSQPLSFQNGISIAGGLSSTTHYTNDFKKISEKNISEKLGFSWEIGYLNTKSLNEKIAFTYGISVMSLRNSFSTGNYRYEKKDGSNEIFDFVNSEIINDRYLAGISFRWSFFLNQGNGRFYIGPGFTFTAPIYNVTDVSGSTSVTDSISFKDKYFNETGPYLFIPLEAFIGYQKEFNDCSLLRIEAYTFYRVDGLIMKADIKHLENLIGIRMSYFFNTY
jgi:hypothetical protein